MEENKKALMKICSVVLRERVGAENDYKDINLEFQKFFSRKDLIEIITHKIYMGKVPTEINLTEMENKELLSLIPDDMYVISHLTERWSHESEHLPDKPAPAPKKTPEERRKERLEKREKKEAEKNEAAKTNATKKNGTTSTEPVQTT